MSFDLRSMYGGLPSGGPASGLIYTDITDAFRRATAEMRRGEVVKDVAFSLFDSVAALEIMDPKMDINCAEAQKDSEPEYDCTRELTAAEVLGLMDQLLSQEMAWHIGYPLGLTLFTSHYVDRMLSKIPSRVSDVQFDTEKHVEPGTLVDILRVYVLGLIRTCSFVNENIIQEHYYEEEDFVTNTYGRSLFDHIPVRMITDEINKIVNLLPAMVIAGIIDPAESAHLSTRLKFRSAFLTAIETSQDRENPERIRLAWDICQTMEAGIQASRNVGTPVPQAFSRELQKKLSSSMPPRPIVDIGLEAGYDKLHVLISDSLKVVDVLGYTNPIALQKFVNYFQSKKPTPFVLVRTMLQRYLFQDFIVLGHITLRRLIDDDFQLIIDPRTPLLDSFFDFVNDPQDPRAIIAATLEEFRSRAVQCYLDLYRSVCQNRCRVRRAFYHVVRDWDFLELEAGGYDEELRRAIDMHNAQHPDKITQMAEGWKPLQAWAKLYKLNVMVAIIELGFELDIYQKHELAGMYWYHTQILNQLNAHHIMITNHTNSTSSPIDNDSLIASHHHFHKLTSLERAFKMNFSDALRALYTTLTRMGTIQSPKYPCGTNENRFAIRMRPFKLETLPLPSFELFQDVKKWEEMLDDRLIQRTVDGLENAGRFLTRFGEMVMTEKKFTKGSLELQMASYEGIREGIRQTEKVLKTILEAKEQGKKLRVEMLEEENHYNDMWIVPTVTIV